MPSVASSSRQVTGVAESVPERSTAGTRPTAGGRGLDALGAVTDAVQAGAGLPEILRAAARALDSSLVLIDRASTVLAVAARSPADERSLMRDGEGVTTIELKVADTLVGTLRMRARDPGPEDGPGAVPPHARTLRWPVPAGSHQNTRRELRQSGPGRASTT